MSSIQAHIRRHIAWTCKLYVVEKAEKATNVRANFQTKFQQIFNSGPGNLGLSLPRHFCEFSGLLQVSLWEALMWEKEQGILPGHVAAESKLGSTWQLLSHPTSSTNAFNIERSCNPSRATSLNPSRRQHLQEAAVQLAAPLDPRPLNSSSVNLFRSKVLARSHHARTCSQNCLGSGLCSRL